MREPDSVHALVREGDVLVSTMGPFERLGDVAADAAASRGAHYMDSTDEVGFVRRLQERHPAAASDDAVAAGGSPLGTMVPAFGHVYVPGILAGALALECPETLRVGYFSLPLGARRCPRCTWQDPMSTRSQASSWRPERSTCCSTTHERAG